MSPGDSGKRLIYGPSRGQSTRFGSGAPCSAQACATWRATWNQYARPDSKPKRYSKPGGRHPRTGTGTPLDPDNWFGKFFVPTAVKAKLRPASLAKDRDDEQLVGLHTLRHTYASLLINQGESIKYVSKQLGHASITITADLYGHLFKETSVSAMNKLSMRIHGPAPTSVVGLSTGTNG